MKYILASELNCRSCRTNNYTGKCLKEYLSDCYLSDCYLSDCCLKCLKYKAKARITVSSFNPLYRLRDILH